MTIIIGLDPGKTGGVARLSMTTLKTVVMPPLSDLVRYLRLVNVSGAHVFIEKCQSFPGQGISSAFNYGVHFGELIGMLVTLGLPHTLVPPKTWTKVMHAGTKDDDPKKRSLEAAKRLFPGHDWLATERCKVPHDGMIDAALIAAYGDRVLSGKDLK